MSKSASQLFQAEERQLIVEAIQRAEGHTTGEVRVFIEDRCSGDVLERAKRLFFELDMHKTANSNGTLVYLAVKDHKFAVLGDRGIDNVVPPGFWDTTRDVMRDQFSQGNFLTGLVVAIDSIGLKLQEFFPKTDDDVNELPDEVIIR
ncbi:MAG: TPM domain-containing protein [Bacteroidia bacterium]|nr:TPM domain-containing protein [Bacteroidia bacterium]